MRDKLKGAEQQATLETTTEVTSRLLPTLTNLDAAFKLKARIKGDNLASELVDAFRRVRAGSLPSDHFRPLILSVLEERSDIDIWRAVFSTLTTLAHSTPPPSTHSSSVDETPVIRCSSSFRGSEQTRRNLEPALFYEIQHCTYRNVEGFFPKYFEDKSWERRIKVILRSVKSTSKRGQITHDSTRWVGISDRLREEEILDWVRRFQSEYLSKAPSHFHAARQTKDLTGAEGQASAGCAREKANSRKMS